MTGRDTKKPLPTTRLGLFLEDLQPWRNTLLVGGALLGLFIASRFEALEGTVAPLATTGAVSATLVAAWLPTRDGSLGLRVLGLCLAVAVGAFVLHEVWVAVRPSEALAQTTLAAAHGDADLEIPEGVEAFEVEVRGHLLRGDGAARGHYRLDVERGDREERLFGELTRDVQYGRAGGRGPTTESFVEHEVARTPVVLPGNGPVHVHLGHSDGLQDRLEVSLFELPLAGTPLWLVLGCMCLAALALEAWAGREAIASRWTAAVAASGAVAVYLVYNFDPDHPLRTIVAAGIVALLTGGLGGWIVGVVVSHLARPRAG